MATKSTKSTTNKVSKKTSLKKSSAKSSSSKGKTIAKKTASKSKPVSKKASTVKSKNSTKKKTTAKSASSTKSRVDSSTKSKKSPTASLNKSASKSSSKGKTKTSSSSSEFKSKSSKPSSSKSSKSDPGPVKESGKVRKNSKLSSAKTIFVSPGTRIHNLDFSMPKSEGKRRRGATLDKNGYDTQSELPEISMPDNANNALIKDDYLDTDVCDPYIGEDNCEDTNSGSRDSYEDDSKWANLGHERDDEDSDE